MKLTKTPNRLHRVFLSIAMGLVSLATFAATQQATIDGLLYTLDTETLTAEVAQQPESFSPKNLIIPSQITYGAKEYTVTSIGRSAFTKCRYNFEGSITLPSTLVIIKQDAFNQCFIEGELNIPGSVKIIEPYAFYECNQFTSLKLNYGLESIGDYALACISSCKGDLEIPNSVKTLGECAFYYSDGFDGKLTVPGSITTIGDQAFALCQRFTQLELKEGIKNIGIDAFSSFGAYGCAPLVLPNTIEVIADGAFMNNGFTGNVTIPENVREVGSYAFYQSWNLEGTLEIGRGVQSIGENCFAKCKFTDIYFYPITVPALVNGNGGYWFSENKSEVSPNWPNGVNVYVRKGSINSYMKNGIGFGSTDMFNFIEIVSEPSFSITGIDEFIIGGKESLTIEPSDAVEAVSWKSSDESVATVSSTGEVTAVGPGTAVITATALVETPLGEPETSSFVINVWQKGDSNGDGKVDVADVATIGLHLNGKDVAKLITKAADYDGDGNVTAADAEAIADIVAKQN